MTAKEDKELTCRDCNGDFVWTAGEQTFYEEKQLHAPVRCKSCRDRRRAEREMSGA